MEIMELVLEEMKSRKAYLYDIYTPYFVCSYAMHCFNLLNLENKIYWQSKRIPNMRLHLMFIAPPGYMKSYYMDNMGADETCGIFANTRIKLGVEQAVTEAGLIGTFIYVDDVPTENSGSARIYNEGIMIIDEFSAMTNAMKTTYNNQLDTQLLSALDHGKIRKRLGSGFIEYQTNFTLWGGVQPARYDFTSGMGRRMWFMLFLPTKQDNDILLTRMNETRNIVSDPVNMSRIWTYIDKWVERMKIIKSIKFDDSVLELYQQMGIYSYDANLMDRLVLGYHLATYGPEERMRIDVEDKRLVEMMKREKRWRDNINNDVVIAHMQKMIASGGVYVDGEYRMPKKQLMQDALMVGLNGYQVTEVVTDMVKMGIVQVKGGNTIILQEE
jgi:hypothetical protein